MNLYNRKYLFFRPIWIEVFVDITTIINKYNLDQNSLEDRLQWNSVVKCLNEDNFILIHVQLFI